MPAPGAGKWFQGALVASGIAFAATVVVVQGGGGPGGGGGAQIDLLTSWTVHQIIPGANGAGQPDGADGVDVADMDGDGLLDVITGHEQGLRVTVAFNPGPSLVEGTWPFVTLPTVNWGSTEDAIACDVDKDGALDVVSAAETGTFRVEIAFAPAPPNTRAELLTASNWTRVSLDASANNRSMRAACADLDGDGDIELVIGGKDANGVASSIGFYSSTTPRTGASWTYTSLQPVGWVMQMYVVDLDGNGTKDIVYSDKVSIDDPAPDGTKRGLRWLDSSGGGSPTFTPRQIFLEGDHKWFWLHDWDGDGDLDIADCRSSTVVNESNLFINNGGTGAAVTWTRVVVAQPTGVGQCQAATVADVDKDGQLDLAFSYSNAQNLESFVWLKKSGNPLAPTLARGNVAGILSASVDVKMDNVAWVDVDGDSDLDAINTEQHVPNGNGPGLGVIYFENPLIASTTGGGGGPPDAGPGGGGSLVCSTLTSGTDIVASTTAVTSSVTPGANRVVYAAFQSALAAGPAAPTGVTGNGLTWVQVDTLPFHTSNARRISVFRAMGASPTAGAITATWGINQTAKLWSVVECDGVDTTGTNGSGATVQSVTTTGTAVTTVTNTLAALAAPTSVHLAFTGLSIGNSIAPDADFVELTDVNTATGTSTLEAEWATNQTVITPTFPSANAGAISVEVKAP
jgi:hypothetical protein